MARQCCTFNQGCRGPFRANGNIARPVQVPLRLRKGRGRLPPCAQRQDPSNDEGSAQRGSRDEGSAQRSSQDDVQRQEAVRKEAEEADRARQLQRRQRTLRRITASLTMSPGLTGTAALVLGYFLHLNPYGSFHLDLDALLLGVACCAPVIALDAAVGLSDHQSRQGMSVVTDMKQLQRVMSLEAPPKDGKARDSSGNSEAAAESGSEGEQAAEAGAGTAADASSSNSLQTPAVMALAKMTAKADSSEAGQLTGRRKKFPARPAKVHFKRALGRLQERILRTGGQYEGLPLAAALALTTAADFGEVMLEVGIIFTGVAKWEVNRLYEAGLDDTVTVLGRSVPLPVAGQAAALATIVVSFIAWAAAWSAVQEQVSQRRRDEMAGLMQGGKKARSSMEWRFFKQALKQSGAREPAEVAEQLQRSLTASHAMFADVAAMLEAKKRDARTGERWRLGVMVARDAAMLLGSGSCFILTGNLFSPFCGSLAVSGLQLLCGRYQIPRLRERQAALLRELKDDMQNMKKGRPDPLPEK